MASLALFFIITLSCFGVVQENQNRHREQIGGSYGYSDEELSFFSKYQTLQMSLEKFKPRRQFKNKRKRFACHVLRLRQGLHQTLQFQNQIEILLKNNPIFDSTLEDA